MITPTPKRFHWWPLVLAAAVSMVVWFRFSYPQLSFVNFSISRNDAVDIAKKFLASQNVNVNGYTCAVTFSKESQADQYLQKTIGFDAFKSFVLHHDFDLFFWLVRFFKEGEEEEFRVSVSAKSGQVTGYRYSAAIVTVGACW
jgi:hypothetical protein